MLPIRRVLAPLDLSECSIGMIPCAQAVAARYCAELVLLHVERDEELTKVNMDPFGDLNIRRVVYEGDPADVITGFVRSEGIDLVVMPTHGYGAFRRFLIGSVTAKVLHDVDCPVLTGVHCARGRHPASRRRYEPSDDRVTLLYRKGYFRQSLKAAGIQTERPEQWNPSAQLKYLGPLSTITIERRQVRVAAWRYQIQGISGHVVPVYMLDTDLPENAELDRRLTDTLYGGDDVYRLSQETVLGIGGYYALGESGFSNLETYHMNEGHSAFLALALIEARLAAESRTTVTEEDVGVVRKRCVFTTHTPVPAGHDQFSRDLVERVLGRDRARLLESAGCYHNGSLNMTFAALRCSHYINGVAMRHGEISRGMFPGYPISAITNGVHAVSWTAAPFRDLFDRHLAAWRHDNRYLRYAIGTPLDEFRQAHQPAKGALFAELKGRTGVQLDPRVFTIGFARRAAVYKRPELLFSDVERLKRIARQVGSVQIVYSGKAHPRDFEGKTTIQHVFAAAAALKGVVPVVYVENYDLKWGKLLTSGVDLWLNTPQRPEEASGTSGMKAALNGVPSLSILDGWWIEGWVEGVTGWAIGADGPSDPNAEASSLYTKLESVILPMFYRRDNDYAKVMRYCIALNGAFFNTQRMLSQYISNAYGVGSRGCWPTKVENIEVRGAAAPAVPGR